MLAIPAAFVASKLSNEDILVEVGERKGLRGQLKHNGVSLRQVWKGRLTRTDEKGEMSDKVVGVNA